MKEILNSNQEVSCACAEMDELSLGTTYKANDFVKPAYLVGELVTVIKKNRKTVWVVQEPNDKNEAKVHIVYPHMLDPRMEVLAPYIVERIHTK